MRTGPKNHSLFPLQLPPFGAAGAKVMG